MTPRPSRPSLGRVKAAWIGLLTVTLSAATILAAPQESDSSQPLGDRETQETAAMRESTFKELAKAQEAAEASNFTLATQILEKLRSQELNSYEQAQVLNLFAYIHYSQNRMAQAMASYEQLLALPNLPGALTTSTLYTLAQLYFSQEQWQKSVDTLRRWFDLTPEPPRQAYEMMCQAYYQQEKYRDALPHAIRVVELTQKSGEAASENAYLMLRVLYYELKDFPKVVATLHELIKRWPKKQYWMQLASLYGEMEDQKRQLATLELAYLQGYLDREADLLSLVSLLLNNEVYLRAGKILETGLRDGAISSTLDNWRLLAQAWTLAREYERAIPALARASELSPDGKVDVLLAQAHSYVGRWPESVTAARSALRRGGLGRPDQVQVMLGQALFELGEYEEAKAAFLAAQADRRSREVAAGWLSYIDSEQERQAQLKAALE